MKFLDRKNEIAELRRVLNPETPPKFVVVFGRRRLGKSTLIKRVLTSDDIYYMAGDFVDQVQLSMLQELVAQKVPEIASVHFKGWEELLLMLNRLTERQFTLCLDEFPYMVKHSPELPSVLQRLIDSNVLKYNIIVCGSSQRMMQNMILSQSEPLFGRASAIIDVRPIPLPYIQEALGTSAIESIEEYCVWGGVPRYWELREEYKSLYEAIYGTMLGTSTVLYDEPKKLFLDDMSATVQSESLMSVIAGGAHRLSEIASRMGRDATSLSAPIDRLIQMAYVRREIPFGDSPRKSKKGIYRIGDSMMDFYYKFIVPNLSALERGRKVAVMEEIEHKFAEYVSVHWEYLCREAVSGNKLFGHRWKEASAWWGTLRDTDNGGFVEAEFDVVAESVDGSAILVGECKWTNPEVAANIHKKLCGKASLLPFVHGKEVIPVLFLKHKSKDSAAGMNILYPQDVIDAMYED